MVNTVSKGKIFEKLLTIDKTTIFIVSAVL